MTPRFSDAMVLRPGPVGDLTADFDGDLGEDWTIGPKVHGGVMVALCAKAAREGYRLGDSTDTGLHPVAVSANFLSAPDPGPVRLRATVRKRGRRIGLVDVDLIQGQRACVHAAITLGAQIEQTIDFDCLISADVAEALASLAEALDDLGVEPRQAWTDVASLRPAIIDRILADARTVDAMRMVEAIDNAWPADGAVVCDMAVAGYWYGGYSSQTRPRRLQYPVGWGTLGFALPAAIGPASVGIPTLAVCGDGGPMFALGELATYAQESLPITLLVVDDGGYGMLRFDQQVFGHPERGVDLLTPEWHALGSAFGIAVHTVGEVGELPAALAQAHEANLRGEPRMIVWKERLFPPRTTSPRWSDPA